MKKNYIPKHPLTTLPGFCILLLAQSSRLIAQDEAASDSDISFAIENALQLHSSVTANEIDITTSEGIAKLSGEVRSVLEKERALRIAESVRGVEAVVDTLSIDAPARSDDEIRADVTMALAMDPGTDAYDIKIRVEDGTVALSGSVLSRREQELAIHVAKGIKGVKKVESELSIKNSPERTDAEILADVNRALEIDALIDNASSVDVTVEGGNIVLLGKVDSMAEKSRVIRNAWVAGATSVNADGLKVDPWMKDEEDQGAEKKSDEWIQKAVKDALALDPRVYSFDPSVSVKNGVVTLSGRVDNLKAKNAAKATAWNTKGVRRIKNYLKVRPSKPVTDELLEKNVKDALYWSTVTESSEIGVRATNRVITLTGSVDSFTEKAEAEDIARRTNGVVAIVNRLSVDGPNAAKQYFEADPSLVYDPLFAGTYGSSKSDLEIREDIESEFFWSVQVDGDDIDVSVDRGIATLTGTVESWREVRSASENAREGGALGVVNRLTVE